MGNYVMDPVMRDSKRKGNKVRKVSFGIKLLGVTCLMIIILSAAFCIASYHTTKSQLIQMGTEEAAIVGKIAAEGTNAELVKKIGPQTDDSTPEYKVVLRGLKATQKDHNILNLYTLYVDGEKIYYGVDADSSELHKNPGTEYEKPLSQLQMVFNGEQYFEDFITHDSYGDTISVYYPLYDPQNEFAGVIVSVTDASLISEKIAVSLKQSLIIAVAGVAVGMAIMVLCCYLLLRNMRIVDAKIYDVANTDGDLTSHLDIRSGDEFELIAKNVNGLITYFREIMLVIRDEEERLGVSSSNIDKIVEEIEQCVQTISSTMEEMSAGMENTSSSLNSVNARVDEISKLVEQTASQAKGKNEEVMQTLGRVKQLRSESFARKEVRKQEVEEIVEKLNSKIKLAGSVKQVDSMASEIVEIADETNLLSLNASIEAARAGEAGRGFAVVAEAIGSLAVNSSSAAERIRKITQEVIEVVTSLSQEATAMADYIRKTNEDNLNEVTELTDSYMSDIDALSKIMSGFDTSFGGVRKDIEDIRDSVDMINMTVEDNAQGITNVAGEVHKLVYDVEKARGCTDEIDSSAGNLDNEVKKFKLE